MTAKSDLKPHLVRAAFAAALAAVAATAIAAQNLPKEGKFAYRACFSGTSKVVALSKSHVALSVDLTGESVADTPGTLYDHASFRCEGLAANFGKEHTNVSYCLFLDPDGDKSLHQVTMRNGKWHVQEIAGTGKYDGIVVHAEVQPMGRFPTIEPGTFQSCNHSSGTYRMK